ncbi:putative ubiquitin conjugating enzyme, partial [Wilcoxina mikolae CBS 423.85]
ADTPYQSGIYFLRIDIPQTYPFHGPVIRFLTRVYHPNINCRGEICLDWCCALSLERVLAAVSGLVSLPNPDDPLVPEIAEIYKNDRCLFDTNARLYTAKYATADQISLDEPRIWLGSQHQRMM